jgi:hypothetical protein
LPSVSRRVTLQIMGRPLGNERTEGESPGGETYDFSEGALNAACGSLLELELAWAVGGENPQLTEHLDRARALLRLALIHFRLALDPQADALRYGFVIEKGRSTPDL